MFQFESFPLNPGRCYFYVGSAASPANDFRCCYVDVHIESHRSLDSRRLGLALASSSLVTDLDSVNLYVQIVSGSY